MSDNKELKPVCYHCGLSIPPALFQHPDTTLIIDNQAQYFCCVGCKTVTQLINQSGLSDFYQYRTSLDSEKSGFTKTADILNEKNRTDFTFYDDEKIQEEFVKHIDDNTKRVQLYVEGIHCTACTWLIEQYIGNDPTILSINVNSSTHTCLIDFKNDASLAAILEQFVQLGYLPKPSLSGQSQPAFQSENKTALLRLAVAGFAMVQVGMFAIALYAGEASAMAEEWQWLFRWISLIVATPVVLFSAKPFFSGARRALITKRLTMDVPVALAIGLAFIASCWATVSRSGEVYFDSVSMFTFFLLLGRYLEMRVRHKNEQGIYQLQYLLPPHVTRLTVQNKSVERNPAALSQIIVGDYLSIKEGEVIPVDGVVSSISECIYNRLDKNQAENIFVNESLLTGESTPIKKLQGARIFAGTINCGSELIVKVTATGQHTRLSAIQQLMSEALHQKPKQVSRADSIAGYFVGFVLCLSVIVATTWFFIDPERTIWITLSVLVVTCPCALSLATPVSITAAIYRLRQLGLLVTKSHVVDGLSQINHIVFDKTGTLTTGNMSIDSILYQSENRLLLCDLNHLLSGNEFPKSQNTEAKLSVKTQKESIENILSIAQQLEAGSTHPIARAFGTTIKKMQFANQEQYSVENSKPELGAGVEGYIDGVCYRIGKLSYVTEIFSDRIREEFDGQCTQFLLQQNESEFELSLFENVVLANSNGIVAMFNIQDTVRPESKSAVEELHERDLAITLLSGDSESAVESFAKAVGIKNYLSRVSPEDKLNQIQRLQQQKSSVLMVGDGLNDLPVLSGADVSIAMSSASDLAQVQADSVLLHDDLAQIPHAIDCAKFSQRIIYQNLTWVIVYNGLALPLAALGLIPPWLAAIGMSLSSLLVVLNATRIHRYKPI